MGSQIRVTTASESACKPNRPLQSTAIYFRVSTTSRFVSAEPPTMARPWHPLSLGLSRSQHTMTGASTATPRFKQTLEPPRRTGTDVTGASPQYFKDRTTLSTTPSQQRATGLGQAASVRTTPCNWRMYHPCPLFNYKREGPGPFRGIGHLRLGLGSRN